ncbi:MAG: hypothetical protein QXT33_03535 [Thermofilum sp.]
MNELLRILGWVMKIGEEEVLLSEISRNSRKAHEVLELLRARGVVNVRKKGRLTIVSLNEKGLEILSLLKRARELLETQGPLPAVAVEPEAAGELPSFVAGNPWFSILAQRGRSRVGL